MLWLLVPLAAIIEMGHHGCVQSRIPRDRDWESAAALIDAGWQEGDLVVISPWWASQGWQQLGRFMSVEQMAREDDSGYGRIWEVALPGHGSEPFAETGTLLDEQRAGRLTVRTYRFPDAPTNIHDFVAALETDASVAMIPQSGGAAEPCTFRTHPKAGLVPNAAVQTGKFVCDPRLPWNNVAREVIADLANRPRLCIWAHPVAQKRIRITFENVPEGAVIEGHTGLKYEAARETIERPPIFLEVSAAGKVIGTHAQERGTGWTPYRFDLGPAGTGGTVTFEIFSQDVGMGHFCFTAKLRDH
jgi:hypothetical protein